MNRPGMVILASRPHYGQLLSEGLGEGFQVHSLSYLDLPKLQAGSILAKVVILAEFDPNRGPRHLAEVRKLAPSAILICHAESADTALILAAFRGGASDFLHGAFQVKGVLTCLQRLHQAPSPNRVPRSKAVQEQSWFRRLTTQPWQLFRRKLTWPGKTSPPVQLTTPSLPPAAVPAPSPPPLLIQKPQPEPDLSGYLMGKFAIYIRGELLNPVPGKKTKSLLAYLLFQYPRKIAREQLMELFWPDSLPECARNCLNVALHQIRKTFHAVDPHGEHILFQDECYLFNPALTIHLDVRYFLDAWKKGRLLEQESGIAAALQIYQEAVAYYEGDFLNEYRYEDWVAQERENLKEIYLVMLDRLSDYYGGNGHPEFAATLCKKMLIKDPCREDIHRRLMFCYYRLGKRSQAMKQYYICRDQLEQELEVVPTQETQHLYALIRQEALELD